MPPKSQPLTDIRIRALAADRPRKVFDGRGLYIEVTKAGSKQWRLKYRFGTEKRLPLGAYPGVSLKRARELADEARGQIARGIDPAAVRKAAKYSGTGDTFETVAREWLAGRERIWAESNYSRTLSFFVNDVFPFFGSHRVGSITAPQILVCVRRVEKRAIERAHRGLASIRQVMRYAVATGRAERNPAEDLKGSLPPVKPKHFPAPTTPLALTPILRALNGYQGSVVVMAALRLAPMLFVRPGELRHWRWDETDLQQAIWSFESSKTHQQHIVPLARQAVEILRELQPVTGRGPYVLPNPRDLKRPMSDNALLAAFRRMGIPKEELVGHGFRATARTLLDEVLGYRPDIIEHQLAHAVKDPNGVAYNRTKHLDKRRKMMQAWADYLDKLAEAEVLPFTRSA